MKYRICRQFVVESGHMLSKHPDKCRFPHGHSRTVEVILEAASLDSHEMVCDFKVLKDMIGKFVDRFDHAMCVNTKDEMHDALVQAYGQRVISFDGDPTTEAMARMIYNELCTILHFTTADADAVMPIRAWPDIRVCRVRVWETRDTWAEVEESVWRNQE